MVQQEYVPTDVDEAEFEIRVTAPLDASIAAMDDVMRRDRHRRAQRARRAKACWCRRGPASSAA